MLHDGLNGIQGESQKQSETLQKQQIHFTHGFPHCSIRTLVLSTIFFKTSSGNNCSILWLLNGATFVEVITSIEAVKSTSRHSLSWSKLFLVYVLVTTILELITISSWTGMPEFAGMTTQNILSACAICVCKGFQVTGNLQRFHSKVQELW